LSSGNNPPSRNLDPRQLRVAEAVRLLNSSPLGEVIQPHVVYRHLNRAASRIASPGNLRRLDLLRYAAWLFHERQEMSQEPDTSDSADSLYSRHKDAVNARSRAASESSRDIGSDGWVHPPVNAERKESCRNSFREFCEQYFQMTFHLTWSPDHLAVIAKIEQAVLEGGLFAMAMPRGSGKTSLCETACLWALVYGHRQFVALIGSDEDHAADMLDSIKSELENNDLIDEDFSEVTGPIRALEGIHQRAAGQLYRGARTHIGWTSKEIILPDIEGSTASAGIIKVAGITGRIRGMKHKRADGKTTRPSLVLLDDPQTDESARSPSQCATREQILSGAILGLAGPGKKIAGLMTLTVVRPDDMADRILNRDKHPQWQGQRTKMVYAFPPSGSPADKLWQQYAQIRAEGQRTDRGTGESTAFYRKHRQQMDEGFVVAWPERHNPDELSAIQHAMNLKLDQGETAFWAEYQNEPPILDQGEEMLDADTIASKTNGHQRGEVPLGVNHMTMFIDVQGNALFWMVCGWEDDFTGYILDYGTYPDQKRSYFTLRDVRKTMMMSHPGTGLEGAIYAGLETLTAKRLAQHFRRDDGAELSIERCMIDANWGNSTDVVYQFCRQSSHAAVLMPSHGRYVGASSIPFSDYKPKRGDRVGLHWRVPCVQGRRSIRYALIDTNYWKSFVHARLSVAMGDPGCLSLFAHSSSMDHRMLAEHLTAEYRVKTEGRGRQIDEWKLRTPGRDNHWLDCLVGCAVAASMQGCVLFGTDVRQQNNRPRIKLSSIKRKTR
jgi:hypothetical protein